MTPKRILVLTAFLGGVTVILGAFSAHALKEIISSAELDTFNTGVRYQMYHVIVLLVVNVYDKLSAKSKKITSSLFLAGIIFFSGSIYAITFGVPASYIWFITPLGGVSFIFGWLYLCIALIKSKYD